MDEFDAQAGTVAPLRAALEQMDEQWRRLGAPIAEALRPGISPSDVEALAAQHGLVVPLELKVLWAWHDGAEPGGSPWLNGDGVRAMPFWSKRSRAERVVATVAAYAGFKLVEIDLGTWHKDWLTRLDTDGLLVGLN